MKTFFTLLSLFAGLSYGQMTIAVPQWGDSTRWGDADDSASYIRQRGNTTARDSSGTWKTITPSDSCSKWVRMERGGQRPISKIELSYEVRSSATQTDSTQVLFGLDTRYCKDPLKAYLGCDPIVRYGRHEGTPDASIVDSLYSKGTISGVTWMGTSQEFEVRHGNQVRVCIDGQNKAGGEATDTLYFRGFNLRFQ